MTLRYFIQCFRSNDWEVASLFCISINSDCGVLFLTDLIIIRLVFFILIESLLMSHHFLIFISSELITCSGVFKFLAEAYIYSYHQQKSSVELRSTRRNIDFGKHLVLKQTLLRCLSKLFTFHCRLFLMIQLGEMLVSRNGEETEKITAKPLFSTRFIKIKFDKLQTFVTDYH